MPGSKAQKMKRSANRMQIRQMGKDNLYEPTLQQEQADREYYTSLSKRDQQANKVWNQVTTEAAKHIWEK